MAHKALEIEMGLCQAIRPSSRMEYRSRSKGQLVADLGTKALTSTRIEVLKSMLGMRKSDELTEEKGEKQKKAVNNGKGEMATMAINLITLAASLSVAKAQGEEEEETYGEFYQLMMIYTVLVVLITLMVQAMWKVGVNQCGRNLEELFF